MQLVIGNFTGNRLTDNRFASLVFVNITFVTLCLYLQIHSLVGEMRSKFRDVDVLMKAGSTDNDTVAVDRSHERQLTEVSKMILVMKVFRILASIRRVLELNSTLS